MATAAVTPLASSVEKTNGAKLNRLLIDGGTTVLRKAFDRYHPPAGLATDLNTYKPLLMKLFRKKVLRKPQWEKLFPPTGASPDSSKFDITLLFVLLTNICGLTPPGLDCYTNPAPSDTNTQQSIEGVCKTVDEVLRTQIENQQTLEEVRQTQTKNEQELKKVAAGFQELNTKVDSIKEEGGKDRNDEVLQNLAKSEFRGDIEYYVERFQTGTREWVFDRVQKWLDDRGSQNRVMVISGNAGMGKSVIAAVICKRMQEAGRLTGSHFCKYNNVRYWPSTCPLHYLSTNKLL